MSIYRIYTIYFFHQANEINVRSTINLVFKKNKNEVPKKNASYSDFISKLGE